MKVAFDIRNKDLGIVSVLCHMSVRRVQADDDDYLINRNDGMCSISLVAGKRQGYCAILHITFLIFAIKLDVRQLSGVGVRPKSLVIYVRSNIVQEKAVSRIGQNSTYGFLPADSSILCWFCCYVCWFCLLVLLRSSTTITERNAPTPQVRSLLGLRYSRCWLAVTSRTPWLLASQSLRYDKIKRNDPLCGRRLRLWPGALSAS